MGFWQKLKEKLEEFGEIKVEHVCGNCSHYAYWNRKCMREKKYDSVVGDWMKGEYLDLSANQDNQCPYFFWKELRYY